MSRLIINPTAVQQTAVEDDETVDVTIRKLVLANALARAGINVDVTQVITDGNLEETIEGAPQLTVSILDRGYAALRSGIFGRTVDVELDGVPFRLTEIDLVDVEQLTLTFEHKIVAMLRKQKGALKASRSSVTRAQFVEMMLRECAKDQHVNITFISPEVNKTQPVTAAKVTGRSLVSKPIGGSTAVSHTLHSSGAPSTLKITDWDGSTVTLGAEQLRNAAIVLQVCKQLNAPAKAILATLEACIVEPTQPFANSTGGDGSSVGILQVTSGTAPSVPGGNRLNVAAVVQGFLTNGYWTHGGAIKLAQTQPGLSAGTIAQLVQGSAFPSRYDQAQTGATQIIQAFGGVNLGTLASGSFAVTGITYGGTSNTNYEFSRGQPGQPEDSWTCMQRLAQEVNWRCYVSGRRSVYFITDDDLLDSDSVYRITPDTKGVGPFKFTAEVGGRTVRVHGRRQPKPSEATFDARFDRWAAPAGSVVTVDDYGPGNERWIIVDVQRPLFDRAGTVSVRSPQKALPEPADNTSSSAGGLTLSGGQIVGTTLSGGTIGAGGSLSYNPAISKGPGSLLYALATVAVQKFGLTVGQYGPYPGGRYPISSTPVEMVHASGSYHYSGQAFDTSGPESAMHAFAAFTQASAGPKLLELIHNPGFAVKNGVNYDPGPGPFTAVWAGHTNHVHVAA